MAQYKNYIALKAIGEKIVEERLQQNLEISDIADQAGLSYNTVAKIENGEDALFSSFIEVCYALNLHPKKMLEVELNVKPRNKLSPTRIEKSRLTTRIKILIEKGHFNSWQTTNEIVEKLQEHFDLNAKSKNVSTILRRFSSENFLKIKRDGRKNLYIIAKK